MRISSINLKYSQNIQLKKAQQHNKQNSPSFGKFENEEVKELTYKAGISDYEDCPEKMKRNPHGVYASHLKDVEEEIDYFEHKSLVTVKKWNGSDGKQYPYIALNRAETDKHEHKELFNDIVENAQSYPIEIEEEIIAKDPDFIKVISNNIDLIYARESIEDAETGYVYTPPEDTNNNSCKEADDLWMEAVLREIHS